MYFLIAALFSLVSAAAFAGEAPPAFFSRHLSDHPLAGRIWSLNDERFVEPNDVATAAGDSRFVLLGEIHDNPDHHALQAWLLGAIVDAGRRPALTLEMIPVDMQADVDTFLASESPDAEMFGKAVNWEGRGWPDWAIYQPIMDVALAAGLPIKAGDAAKSVRKSVAAQGLDALPPGTRSRLGLVEPLPEGQRAVLEVTLFRSHCGLVPKPSLQPMADIQRLRDASLADAMLMSGKDGAVLIAGGGHVRADLGVPLYLARRAGQDSSISIAFREVEANVGDPRQMFADTVQDMLPYDFVWFTPGIVREDPCESLKGRFGGK
ncbi:ChaN family lipoprotein [Stappia sp. F7233]|uniref:ChaN family lipoprotein n=1 Tax=Stappia albiluteola TaxID=2758565 RepID=A0A839ACR1_9HYPH|nr:ChaN family lipoprotein [Stappia albiluteola]MBA5776895.1 ChaN family lipoprotein [Stappia albiluteola]